MVFAETNRLEHARHASVRLTSSVHRTLRESAGNCPYLPGQAQTYDRTATLSGRNSWGVHHRILRDSAGNCPCLPGQAQTYHRTATAGAGSIHTVRALRRFRSLLRRRLPLGLVQRKPRRAPSFTPVMAWRLMARIILLTTNAPKAERGERIVRQDAIKFMDLLVELQVRHPRGEFCDFGCLPQQPLRGLGHQRYRRHERLGRGRPARGSVRNVFRWRKRGSLGPSIRRRSGASFRLHAQLASPTENPRH